MIDSDNKLGPMPAGVSFKVIKQQANGKARVGVISTPHGDVETPAFIFCGTKAAMKGLTPQQVKQEKTQIILSNTYHLMLSPGADRVAHFGGLQKFTGWRGPMFTDSGGFQIFSLGHGSVAAEIKKTQNIGPKNRSLVKITEEGACFKSYVNGDNYLLTPERSIEVQCKLGADLIVSLDECTPYHVPKSYTKYSMEMSHRWELRSLKEFKGRSNGRQGLYGIVQGGVYEDLRRISAEFVNSNDFFGCAIGGCLGSSKEQMNDVVAFTMDLVLPQRPVHLLGIGGLSDIISNVRWGIDTFDCTHPTRLARHGGALVSWRVRKDIKAGAQKEHINLKNQIFAKDDSPIDPNCQCEACRSFSRGYLHYLLKAKEMTAMQALSLHNIRTINDLFVDIRDAIKEGRSLAEVSNYWLGP